MITLVGLAEARQGAVEYKEREHNLRLTADVIEGALERELARRRRDERDPSPARTGLRI